MDAARLGRSSRTPLVVGLVLVLAVIAGLATERVIAEQNHRLAVADLQDENDAQGAELRELRADLSELEDSIDATEDVSVEMGTWRSEGNGTEVPVTIRNTGTKTQSFMIEITIIHPDTNAVFDTALISTPTLRSQQSSEQTLHYTTNGSDWPTADGYYYWDIASAVGL